MSITSQDHPRACRRVWAQDVNVAVDVIETRLDSMEASPDGLTPAQQAVDDGIRRRLAAARSATLRQDPVPGALSNWWRGTLVDAAYQNLHAAEAMLVGLYSPDEVEAEIPEAVARVECGLDRDDPRRIAALRLLEVRDPDPVRRARLAKAVEVGFGAADAEYARLRNFRNTVLGGAVTMSALLVLFTVYVMRNPGDVPFCFTPDGTREFCASGPGPASAHDVLTVVLLGSLGGLLAAILAIRNMRGTASPYNVPQALALLKLPLGAVSAIGALIAIRGGFIPGFSDLDSQEQILAYAFGFGLAQQLLTGLVDRQARSILTTAPGKASGASRPERSAGRLGDARQEPVDVIPARVGGESGA
ncbi:hypothetical protein [Nocardioides mangrovi]|uniref:Uncharacterized protein n=1 Tax=Nocardioides mangrovi TaxID=2874580 RepID=A0ABS7UA42_9ACTN|nr:hypothetical protein [Nocardioides mangrovi]MBZ5737687.1 hypothetical protein [Nocardioides mangrovi]